MKTLCQDEAGGRELGLGAPAAKNIHRVWLSNVISMPSLLFSWCFSQLQKIDYHILAANIRILNNNLIKSTLHKSHQNQNPFVSICQAPPPLCRPAL